jgi:hypothetical protein
MYDFGAHIIPCNAAAQFNELARESVQLRACGRTYKVQFQKGPTKTHLGG